MDEPDPQTLRSAAAGDRQAFESLVRTCQADVWRFLVHLVGDDDLAADLTQETFLRVHRGLGSFRSEGRFSSWLFRIARNLATDALRSRQRRLRLDLALQLRHRRQLDVDATRSVGDEVELQDALDALPVRLRESFVLVEVMGLRYREAAVVLGVADGTIKSRLFAARRELVAWFETTDEAGHG